MERNNIFVGISTLIVVVYKPNVLSDRTHRVLPGTQVLTSGTSIVANISQKNANTSSTSPTCFWLGFFSIYAVYFVAPTINSCQLVNPILIRLMPFISLFVYNIIPITGLSLICSFIWHTLGQLPTTYLHGGHRLHDQVSRMIMSQIIIVILTSTPSAAYSIYTISTQTIIKSLLRSKIENLVNTICVLIGFLTKAIMFYVYLIALPHFHLNAIDFLRVIRNRFLVHVNKSVISPTIE